MQIKWEGRTVDLVKDYTYKGRLGDVMFWAAGEKGAWLASLHYNPDEKTYLRLGQASGRTIQKAFDAIHAGMLLRFKHMGSALNYDVEE